jgi:hypothetical protein
VTTKKKTQYPIPPPAINSSRVLFYSLMPRNVGYSGKISIHIGGQEVGKVPRLVIAEPLREKGFRVLHCKRNWELISMDRLSKSINDAKANFSKREAKAFEKEVWSDYECSFCGRIPLDFQMSVRGKQATICNICLNENYHIFLELEQEESAKRPQGDYYPQNGFDHIESYVSRLLSSTMQRRSVLINTLDRERGCSLFADSSMVIVGFIIMQSLEDRKREKKIRKFFASRDKIPSQDYSAQDGRVRIIDYPLSGNVSELTAMTKTILQEICNISPKEALSIKYREK